MSHQIITTTKNTNTMNTITTNNITEAQKTGLKYHVINSNEVHSFSNKKDAQKDLKEAIKAEKQAKTNFKPQLIY